MEKLRASAFWDCRRFRASMRVLSGHAAEAAPPVVVVEAPPPVEEAGCNEPEIGSEGAFGALRTSSGAQPHIIGVLLSQIV